MPITPDPLRGTDRAWLAKAVRLKPIDFFKILIPPGSVSSGWFNEWELPGKTSKHFDVSSPNWYAAAAAHAEALDAGGHNVFFGLGLRSQDCGLYGRGTKRDIACIFGKAVDIDLAGPNHKATNCPPDVSSVVQHVLMPFAAETGAEPTLVVHSGGGMHVYWLFDQPLHITDANRKEVSDFSLAWEERLAEYAKAAGWGWDFIADLSRVLRPVGTHNRKNEPKEVSVLAGPGRRFSYQSLKVALAGFGRITGAEGVPTAAQPRCEALEPAAVGTPSAPGAILTPNEIIDLARHKLKRSKHPERRTIIELVLAGKPFAQYKHRNTTLQKIVSWLAYGDPDSDPEILIEVLRPSLEALAAERPDDHDSIETAVRMLASAQSDARRDRQLESETRARYEASITGRMTAVTAAQAKALISAAPVPAQMIPNVTEGPRPGEVPVPASAAAVPSVAEGVPCEVLAPGEHAATPAPLPIDPSDIGRWNEDVVISHLTYQTEKLGRPYTLEEYRQALAFILPDGNLVVLAPHTKGFEIITPPQQEVYLDRDFQPPTELLSKNTINAKGELRRKTTKEVLKEVGFIATAIVRDMTIDRPFVVPERRELHVPIAQVRDDLEPLYTPEIAQWLALLGGEEHGKLLDWLSTAGNLARPTAALCLKGDPGSGKTLVAIGLAHLYRESGPTKGDAYFGTYNNEFADQPVVLFDEKGPVDWQNKPIDTRRQREAIAATTHYVNAKYGARYSVHGCGRFVYTANNWDFLKCADEPLTAEDRAAIAQRFLIVEAQPEASAYLASLGGFDYTERMGWVNGEDLLARHLLWLQRNHRAVIAPGSRFLVAGNAAKLADQLASFSTLARLFLEATLRYVDGKIRTKLKGAPFLVGNGEVLVRRLDVHENWSVLIGTEDGDARRQRPTAAVLSSEIRNLCEGQDVRHPIPSAPTARFGRLRIGTLLSCAELVGYDVDELKRRIGLPVEEFETLIAGSKGPFAAIEKAKVLPIKNDKQKEGTA